ncbi:hypothetical protein ILUMI_13299 [Ignelater luminosus]|uniref:Integrase catalytic domain-containing protein n=1 Tax=Ignelater luminosus TaxID=2038154 RepID=A0A8K0GC43_IGNLU|nr:hypothetical protein ILUMI_13299 [Ignelater luminosus]
MDRLLRPEKLTLDLTSPTTDIEWNHYKKCNFKAVTAECNWDDYIRDSFISGISFPEIRQRLLVSATLNLDEAHNQANSLESAQRQSSAYGSSNSQLLNLVQCKSSCSNSDSHIQFEDTIAAVQKKNCFFYGRNFHPRQKCPARNSVCFKCNIKGHFGTVCRSNRKSPILNLNRSIHLISSTVASLSSPPPGLSKATVPVTVNEFIASALMDTGSTASFINEKLSKDLRIRIKPCKEVISMASTTFQSSVLGQCYISLKILGHKYNQAVLLVLRNLCCDVLLGHDLLSQHSSISMQFDAYPLPNIEHILNDVANYAFFSIIDLKSAFHQIPVRSEDRKYTAFEAGGQLSQFKRIPLRVTNGVAGFQRKINYIIRQKNLEGTIPDLDDVTVCVKDLEEHTRNSNKCLEAIRKYNLTINFEKIKLNQTKISLLGYIIENNSISLDPERLAALKTLKPPTDGPLLKRVLGMFSHYSNFIHKLSDKIKPIIASKLPLSQHALQAFEDVKKDIIAATVMAIDPEAPFTVETGASSFAVAATLSQLGRPEVKNFLTTNGIASSRTTPYNPQGNRQAERYNGIIWKTVQLVLKNKNLPVSDWENVLNESLHSIRSLPCTATNETPHEQMFRFVRRTGNGSATPSWLTIPGPSLLKKTRNHECAHIRFPDEREIIVSTSDLAPLPSIDENGSDPIETPSTSHEQVYTPSDPTPLQNSPALTVETSRPQNATTPQSIIAPAPQNVALKREWIQCKGLLDVESQTCFITESLVRRLKLPLTNVNIPITGISKTKNRVSNSVRIEFKSRFNNFTADLNCLVLSSITENMPNFKVNTNNLEIPKSLKLADPYFYNPTTINLLKGAEIFWELLSAGHVRLGSHKPILQKTKLGWVIGGPVKRAFNGEPTTSLVASKQSGASRYDKNACDGVGGTTKCEVIRASLQRTVRNQILNVDQIFNFYKEHIKGIIYFLVKKEEIDHHAEKLAQRFNRCRRIVGTRQFHTSHAIAANKIRSYFTSESNKFEDT